MEDREGVGPLWKEYQLISRNNIVGLKSWIGTISRYGLLGDAVEKKIICSKCNVFIKAVSGLTRCISIPSLEAQWKQGLGCIKMVLFFELTCRLEVHMG
jgi:hypothetical protein